MEDTNIFVTRVIIDSIRTLKDNTVKLTVVMSQELRADAMALLFGLANKEAFIAIKENDIKKSDLEGLKLPDAQVEVSEKTPSQRQRAILYLLWKQQGGREGTGKSSDQFYRDNMEVIINHLKAKLD